MEKSQKSSAYQLCFKAYYIIVNCTSYQLSMELTYLSGTVRHYLLKQQK